MNHDLADEPDNGAWICTCGHRITWVREGDHETPEAEAERIQQYLGWHRDHFKRDERLAAERLERERAHQREMALVAFVRARLTQERTQWAAAMLKIVESGVWQDGRGGEEFIGCDTAWSEGQECNVWDDAVRTAASLYADHPDYDENWGGGS